MLLILLIFAAFILQAEDWPRFRGPNGTGISGSTGLPVEFDAGKNMAWRSDVPFGKSSPIIGGSCLFITASQGEKLITMCISPADGKTKWRREIVRTRAAKLFTANDPASPTPSTDGANVYAFFADMGLVSYGPDGNERWRLPLGPFENFYGMSVGPVFANGKILMYCHQFSVSTLYAVDAKNGKVQWKAERKEPNLGWVTPAVYRAPDGEWQVVTMGSAMVNGYSLETGQERWSARQSGEAPIGVPVIHGDLAIFTSNGYDQPWLPMFRSVLEKYDTNKDGLLSKEEFAKDEAAMHFGYVDTNKDGQLSEQEWNTARASGVGDYGVVARNLGGKGALPDSTMRWRLKRNVPYAPAPVIYKDVLFMVKDGGIFTSVNLKTGEILKQGRAGTALGEYFSSPVAADGKVYTANEAGKVAVMKAEAQWEVLAVNDLHEEIYATPAISNGRLFIRTREALYCFGPSTASASSGK
jgi:outer membrane protein assembly factor BamB